MASTEGGLKIEDMVRSRWVYRKLRNFRAGTRPTSRASSAPTVWRFHLAGFGHFRAYVWSSVVA